MMLTFLQQLLATLPVIAALLLVKAVNLPKAHRVRQYPMPIVAAIYAAAALVVLYLLNTWIDDLLRGLFQFVPFLRGIYDTRWQFVIENTAIVLLFVLVKFLFRRLFDRVFQGQNFLGSSLIDGIYRYDADFAMWFVRRRNAMLRVYLRVFYWASIVLVVVLMALGGTFSSLAAFAAISFPALAALVIGEIYFAADGITEQEFRRDILGERDRAQRVANYTSLREVLKETFPDRAIDDGVDFSSTDATRTFDRLDTLSRSASDIDQLAAAYFSRLKQSGTVLDTNLIDAAADIMRGTSTLISNPFYGDLTPYLVFPAYYHLLHYRKCLIICGRDSIADDLVGWVEGGLESITGIPDLWHVEVLGTEAAPDLDVGVLRFADIHNLELIRNHDSFLRDVQYVILAEPSRILATGQLGLGLLLSRCGGAESPVFAAFDRNHDGLVDALSHQLKVNLTDVVAAAVPHGVSTHVVWRADGPHMHSTVLPTVSRYLGMGTEIGAVALKYQVSEVEWIGSDAFPVHDMMWIAGQYYAQINAFADLDISQHALTEAIRPKSNPWDIAPADNRFLVVEDEIRNVYETLRLYATRAEQQGFVNLVSEDYLLRDYMVANASIFAADPKAIPSFAADRARTERNLTLRLMLMLLTFGVSEPDLAREFALIGQPLPPIVPPTPEDRHDDDHSSPAVVVVRQLIERHAGVRDVVIECDAVPAEASDGDDEQLERFFRLHPGGALDAVVDSLRSAYFFVEDEVEDRNYIGSALYGLVYQMYLPGQFITYAGKYYEVQSVGDDHRHGGVVLRRAAEHIRDRRVYRLLRNFRISDVHQAKRAGAQVVVDNISFTRCHATIEVESVGYLEQQSRSDLGRARRSEVLGVPRRSYANKELLRIQMPGVPASVRRTIAVLLNELFVTVFPHAHPYVAAVTTDEERTLGDLLPGLEVDDEGADDAIYIVEDSLVDLGLLVTVHRNWRRLLEIVTDYLVWHETPEEEPAGAIEPGAVAVFPDDSPEEIAERARIAAEQDAGGSTQPRPPRPPRWWRRLWRWVRGTFTRTAPATVEVAAEAPAEPEPRVDGAHADAAPPPLTPDVVMDGESVTYEGQATEAADDAKPATIVPDVVMDDLTVDYDGPNTEAADEAADVPGEDTDAASSASEVEPADEQA